MDPKSTTSNVLLFNQNLIPCNYKNLFIDQLYDVLVGNLITDSYFFMQWMFPAQGKSKWNTHTKGLSQDEVMLLRDSEVIKKNILNSATFILDYFKLTVQNEMVVPQEHLEQHPYWLQGIGHEEKKLSRIMLSLKLSGFNKLADNLQKVSIETLAKKGFKTGRNPQEVLPVWQNIFAENKLY